MSEKEKIVSLLDEVPEYKLGYILAYIQGITASEEDAYCGRIYEDYLQDPDPDKDAEYSLEECKREWGLT